MALSRSGIQIRKEKNHMDILKTVPTNSVTECWRSIPQFRNPTGTEMLPTQSTENQHTVKIQSLNDVESHKGK